MTNTYKIIYRAGSRSFEISPDSPAKLLEGGLSGFDSAGFDVKISSYAALDGGYAVRRRFAERELSLTFEIDRSHSDKMRREIAAMLDPREDGELDVTLYGVHRKVAVIPCGEPVFSRPTIHSSTVVTLFFVAPTVFFSDSAKKIFKFRCTVPLLTFPMNFTAEEGITSGLDTKSDSADTENPGDAECGIIVKLVACGEVVNPGVRCNDKFIRTELTMADGDVLLIDTRKGMKNIYLNGERYFTFRRDSTFFALPMGVSTVSVTADSGGEYIEAEIEYTPLYFGV